MKTKNAKRTTSPRNWIIASSIILLLVAGGLVVANFTSIKDFIFPSSESSEQSDSPAKKNQVDYSTPSDPQTDAGTDIKKNSIDKSESEDDQPTTNNFTTSLTLSENEGIVYVRNEINKITSTGTCTLTVTKGGQTLTKTAGVQPLPQTSTCKGFNIDINKENMDKGSWTFELTVTIGGSKSVATKSLEL